MFPATEEVKKGETKLQILKILVVLYWHPISQLTVTEVFFIQLKASILVILPVDYKITKNQSSLLSNLFSQEMATLRKQLKLATVSKETQERTKNSQSKNPCVSVITEEYITQVSEEMEARVTKK